MDSKIYLGEWFDHIGFLEQRKDGSHILKGVPIPMLQEDIIDEVKHPGESGRLNVDHIFSAMCIVVGLDKHFPYAEDYLQFLKENERDTIDAIYFRMAKASEAEDNERLYLYARAKEEVRGNITDQLETTYAMEGIYNDRILRKEKEGNESLLHEITDRYEFIISKDEDNAYAHMSLGRIYAAQSLYIKSKYYYERALHLAEDDSLKDTLRQCIDEVTEPAAIDGARTYLHYGKYDDALKSIAQVESQYSDPGACAHIKGMAYYGKGDYDRAIDYLKEATKHETSPEIGNDLAIALAAAGDEDSAIETLSRVIDGSKDARTAYMNRGILYFRMENYTAALKDFEAAYRLIASDDLWSLIEETRRRSESE